MFLLEPEYLSLESKGGFSKQSCGSEIRVLQLVESWMLELKPRKICLHLDRLHSVAAGMISERQLRASKPKCMGLVDRNQIDAKVVSLCNRDA
jgi:hypothetical protein